MRRGRVESGRPDRHNAGRRWGIEDDDDVRGALATFLEYEGYSVLEAPDGAAALDRRRAGNVCLVLLDLWMPRMNGLEAADLRVNGYMRKPIEFSELLDYVGRYC